MDTEYDKRFLRSAGVSLPDAPEPAAAGAEGEAALRRSVGELGRALMGKIDELNAMWERYDTVIEAYEHLDAECREVRQQCREAQRLQQRLARWCGVLVASAVAAAVRGLLWR